MIRRFITLLALSLSSLIFASSNVLAHTALSESAPKDGAMLVQAPEKLQLVFTEDVRLLRTKLIRGEDEIEIEFRPSTTQSKEFTVPLPALEHGHYTVNWAVMGADSHTVEGSFGFMLGMMEHTEGSHATHESPANHDQQHDHGTASNNVSDHDHDHE